MATKSNPSEKEVIDEMYMEYLKSLQEEEKEKRQNEMRNKKTEDMGASPPNGNQKHLLKRQN